MQIDQQGQITIPPEVCDRLGLAPGTEIELEVIGETIQLKKKLDRGQRLIEHLRGKAPFQATTDEIMRLTREDVGHSAATIASPIA